MSIRRFLKEKQVNKYILAYLVFIVLNYIICLAPIGASYYFSSQDLLLSSFLAYCFTLLAVTVYSFCYFPRESVGGTIMANLGVMIAVLFMIAYIVMFILYNLVGSFADTLNSNVAKTFSLSFIPAFLIPVALSIPVIRQQVTADKPRQLISTIRKSESEGEQVINQINREGIS